MNLSRFSIYRPVFTSMAALIVVLLGIISLSRLPIDLMPDITYPTINIMTRYENAGPEVIEELIARPIEEAMSAVPGVEEISSVSSEGSSSVRVRFAWGTDLDAASNDIRDRLDRVANRLPEEAEKPVLRKFDPSAFPILILGASSRLDPIDMRRIIDDEVKYRIERVPGVASLDVWGGLEREIHVDVTPDKLKLLGLSLDQILQRIRAANIMLPAGTVEEGHYDLTLRVPGEFANLEELRQTVIAVRDGVPLRLGDVAEVSDSWRRPTNVVRVDGVPGIRLGVSKQSGVNTVDVARRVLAEVEQINRDIPQILITPIIDSSAYIRRSIANVRNAALYGGLFTVLVLLFFLRNLRSVLIISVAIPLSIIGTFVLIYFGGFTLNLMTLGGLALGVGMLVDNAIVVIENIHRRREAGDSALHAALKGSEEVAAPIIASTLTTVAVFLPLVFVRGMAGVMFKQLSYVVGFSLLCSLAAALTLIPMLASRLEGESAAGLVPRHFVRAAERIGRWLGALERQYRRLLQLALEHRLAVLGVTALLLAGALGLMPFIGRELMPQSDEGEVRVEMEMAVGTRLAVTAETLEKLEKIVTREVPERSIMVASAGGSGWRGGGTYSGEMRIALKPKAQRRRSSEQIAEALRGKLAASAAGAVIRTRAGQGLFIIRIAAGDRLAVEIRGHDLETSDALGRQVLAVVQNIPGVTDARLSRELGTPERVILVDRAKAESMKVSVRQVAELLETALTGTSAGYYKESGDEITIRVKLKDAERLDFREILDLTLNNSDGRPVSLRNIVSVQPQSGPVRIERRNQERTLAVQANIYGRDMGSVVEDIQKALRGIPMPQGFSLAFTGDYEEQQKAFSELGLGLALAVLLVYMVMACLYESLRDPFVVMFSVPLAVIGVTLVLFFTSTTFNMQSYIGCIMLGGIVVNNAILLVDTINLLRRERELDIRSAIVEAGARRLRPILMTAATTICGLVPLALGLGEGGEVQAPMARAIVGGLASSTLITLVLVPVVYSFFHKHETVVAD